MASLVDAIHGSGPVMRRPSMDRRACGLSFIFGCQRWRDWNFTPKQRWNDHPVFRRVVTGFASVTINARR